MDMRIEGCCCRGGVYRRFPTACKRCEKRLFARIVRTEESERCSVEAEW